MALITAALLIPNSTVSILIFSCSEWVYPDNSKGLLEKVRLNNPDKYSPEQVFTLTILGSVTCA